MEDAKKRWSATYTKHVKQKRKVYQDGFLDLHVSTCKVKLYDECEKLLECRILKQDEVVSSGETLTFDAYLVDVGDLEGDCAAMPDMKTQDRDKKISEQPNLRHRQKLRSYSVTSGYTNINAEKKKGEPFSLSPSQKFIGEFKKREMQKYGTLRCNPEKTNPGTTGFKNREGLGAPQNSPFTTESNIKEWQVMYTTHVTQKAKKYHDGFLRLSIPGSLQRQVTLYDDCRKLLNSRFLKKDEIVISGGTITFDAHLVDIGEPHGNQQFQTDVNIQGNNPDVVLKAGAMHGQQSIINADKSVAKGKPQNKAYSKEIGDSTCCISAVDRINLSKGVLTNKPLRDAVQILSILQKPKGLEVLDAIADVPENNKEPSQNMDTCKPNEDPDFANCPDDLMSSKSMSNDLGDNTRSCDEIKSSRKMDELPSFDLGF